MKASLLCLTFITPFALSARNPEVVRIGQALADAGCYRADARFEVFQPNSEQPVVYDLRLVSSSAPGDTLSPCNYLIDWTLHTPAGTTSTGFSAYAAGDHFRYREGRLQEYHYDDAPGPFAPEGDVERGVQSRAQFADFLPQMLGRRLMAMAADSAYVMEVSQIADLLTVSGVERRRGYDCREFEYSFDAVTMFPVAVEINANPGQPSEQLMTLSYSGVSTRECPAISEESLIEMYPREFERYRSDSYSLLSLPGGRMPGFEARSVDGTRYTHTAGEPFGAVTVVAVLESAVVGTDRVVGMLREAADASAVPFDLVLAFVDSDAGDIAATGAVASPGVAVLRGARALARDCGVSDTPSIIICSPDGKVSDVMIGRNNDMVSDVIQKAALAADN